MPNNSLGSLTAYSTPVQSQQPPEQQMEEGDTPGQKRKRTNSDAQNNRTPQAEPQHGQQVPSQAKASTPSGPGQEHPADPNSLANANPPPAGPLPSYVMPQYGRPQTPDPPPSPTNEVQKRRKLLNQAEPTKDGDKVQEMTVDEEHHQEVDLGDTPTAAKTGRWYEDDQSRQEGPCRGEGYHKEKTVDVSVEVDEIANAKTLARVITASDKLPMGANYRTTWNPLSKYTEGPMPDIHDEDQATLLAGIDQSQLESWLILPTGKLLARPFDTEVNFKANHLKIAEELATAVKDITGATTAAVAPPNKDYRAPRKTRHPITFLIHNISKENVELLLERKVWSSKEITFQVAPINISGRTSSSLLMGSSPQMLQMSWPA
jgi:hypothetical protein